MNTFRVGLAGLALWAAVNTGYAQDVRPDAQYRITPAAGPWVICAASFMGEQAPQLARDLVLELRSAKYKNQPAYFFSRSDDERRKQNEDVERQRQQQLECLKTLGLGAETPLHIRKVRIEEQYAVLIGGYPDLDTAHHALEAVKKLQAPPTKFMNSFTRPEPVNGDVQKVNLETAYVNPFANSFVARNPTVPVQQDKKWDPFWKVINADETYSLLNCPKHWTLVIKDFQGAAVVQSTRAPSNFLEQLFGSKSGDMLTASAMQAHEVARVLREMHFEAYVFHTRGYSLVTVGGFEAVDDPRLLQAKRQLANLKLRAQAGPPIEMYANPLPMEIPRP